MLIHGCGHFWWFIWINLSTTSLTEAWNAWGGQPKSWLGWFYPQEFECLQLKVADEFHQHFAHPHCMVPKMSKSRTKPWRLRDFLGKKGLTRGFPFSQWAWLLKVPPIINSPRDSSSAFEEIIKLIWLVVWNMNFIFPYIGNNNPKWLSFFSEGLKPPTSYAGICFDQLAACKWK